MLWFIAILAATNLCAGYWLGAQYGWSLLTGEAPPDGRSARDATGEASNHADGNDDDGAAAADGFDPPTTIHEDEPAPPATADQSSKANNVLDGLAAFQAQLAALSDELQTSDDDQAFDDCAGRVQQANHDYLDQAQDAIELLDENSEACEAVQAGADEVRRASDEFDATLDADELTDELRERLRGLSSSIVEAAKSVDEAAGAAPADETPGSDEPQLKVDPETGLATIDSMFERIDKLLEQANDSQPLVVATVQPDPSTDGPGSDELTEQLQSEVAKLVGEIAGVAAAYRDDQLLVALAGDSVDEASHRAEQVRQQIEATTFTSGDDQSKLTVSIALAQSTPDAGRDDLLDHLEEALAEAHRYGGNRSCHHDGKFPAPVMPDDLDIEERTVTL